MPLSDVRKEEKKTKSKKVGGGGEGEGSPPPKPIGEMMNTGADSIRVVHPLFQEEGDGASPISALQLTVRKINVRRAQVLNKQWHSRLPETEYSNLIRNRRCVCFGAEFGNIWYAAAIWTSPVARLLNDNNWLELRRLAISPEAPKNTASRMLRIMKLVIKREMPEIERLISYQDTEVHTGGIYAAAGWVATTRSVTSGRDGWQSRRRNAVQTTADKVRWEVSV